MRTQKVVAPLVFLAFGSLVLFNTFYSGFITNSNVAISSIYEGVTSQDDLVGNDIKFVTILTEPRKYHCTMLASTVFNNITMEVFGWGDTKLHGTTGWWRKILWFKAILGAAQPDDIVVFVDAGDTIFNANRDKILDTYHRVVNKQGLEVQHEWIWSAEKNCGMKTLTKEQCNSLHRVPPAAKSRYMNTGGWAGRAAVGRSIFALVDEDRAGRTNQADQAFVAESHVKRGWRELHGLDYEQSLFMSVYKSERDICGWPEPTMHLRNCETRTVPTMFHFNAGAKDAKIFEPVLHKTWWWQEFQTEAGRERVDNHKVKVNGKEVPLKEICPTGYGLVPDNEVKKVRSMINLGAAEKSHIIVE
ncbi:hypothetical protein DIPPA_24279 [Diplonema papillatum]|nr:hypothetical protein DIPPA_24279 [Diplonema papillatum]